jgi:hypothetical protein
VVPRRSVGRKVCEGVKQSGLTATRLEVLEEASVFSSRSIFDIQFSCDSIRREGQGAEAGRELRLGKRGKCKLESPPQQLIRDTQEASRSEVNSYIPNHRLFGRRKSAVC